MIRVGLIGAADPRHRWFLAAAERRRAGIRIADFSEPDAALRQELAWRYSLPGQPDHRALLAMSAPSLVAVAQRSDAGQAVIDALRHGADVVAAPPVCDTLSGLETIAGLVESGRRVTAAHTYRGHPASRLAKELIDSDRLGRVELVALLAASDRDQRELRRAVLEGLDLFLWLTGATSGAISAVTARHPARREDLPETRAAFGELTMIATATNPTGQADVIFEVRKRPNAAETPEEVIQIVGTTGAMEWDVRTGLLRSALDGADPVAVSCGRLDQTAEWVLNNLLRRSRPVISTAHSLATTRMLLLAERSRQLDGKPQAWQL